MIVVITTWLPRRACSQPGIKPPDAAEQGGGQHRQRHAQDARQPAQIDRRPAPARARQIGLPLATDVEQPGMEGQRHGEAGEDQVGGVVERVADRLAVAEGAVDQHLHGLERALADDDDDQAGDEEGQQRC